MSERESFSELTDRLRREREPAAGRRYDQVAGEPRRPPLPAPLRLPAGDPRRKPTFRGHNIPRPSEKRSTDLPPPLFTGILPYRPDGPHKITDWRWDPELLYWIGRCSVCQYRFRADRETARELEREVEEWCGEHPAEAACSS